MCKDGTFQAIFQSLPDVLEFSDYSYLDISDDNIIF